MQLPPLTEEPQPQLSPAGQPYTLDDLQRLAAANSPTLRQAAADVENARGRMQQARTYQNPTTGFGVQPNANNTGSTTYGTWVDQTITTAGKMKLNAAMAQVDLSNAELALRKAAQRPGHPGSHGLLQSGRGRETVRINRVLARFTDEVYRLQTELLAGGFAASHEPAALRSQVFVVRLAHKQAITNYSYAWKQLVAAIGLPQMPLSAVEGQVDRFIPYYEYDDVLAYVLRNHTDILTARNDIVQADYNLKLAEVTPIPNVDVIGSLWQENQVLPKMEYHQMSVSMQLPLWDQNKGNIRAAAAARARVLEEPHQAELALTTGLAAAYGAYQDNLAAVEYYRMHILPDQVRYYRGVFERRQIDPAFAFNDLVTAQQNLVVDVSAYLGILSQLWTSVINVADYLQTDDFYQLAKPLELPPLPEFDAPHCWPCPHPHGTGVVLAPGQVIASSASAQPAQTAAAALPTLVAPAVPTAAAPSRLTQESAQDAGPQGRKLAVAEPIGLVPPCQSTPSGGATTGEPTRFARFEFLTISVRRNPGDDAAWSNACADRGPHIALARQAENGSFVMMNPNKLLLAAAVALATCGVVCAQNVSVAQPAVPMLAQSTVGFATDPVAPEDVPPPPAVSAPGPARPMASCPTRFSARCRIPLPCRPR